MPFGNTDISGNRGSDENLTSSTIPTVKRFYLEYMISKISTATHLSSIGRRFIKYVETWPSDNPMGWIVKCRKK